MRNLPLMFLMSSPVIAALVLGTAAIAQQSTPPKLMVIETTDQELQAMVNTLTKCLERDAWSCAEFAIYFKSQFLAKAKPKEAPAPADKPSK